MTIYSAPYSYSSPSLCPAPVPRTQRCRVVRTKDEARASPPADVKSLGMLPALLSV